MTRDKPIREDIRPIPDPTVLTTQQLLAASAVLRDAIDAVRKVIETRLDGMDKAIELLRVTSTEKFPLMVESKVLNLKDLHDEKFKSIQTQFLERDTRTEQTSRDSKVAVDAALQAAKEAVGEQNKSSALAIAKSEAATTKQIDQIIALITTTTAGLNDKISDLKDRLTLIEGKGFGSATTATSQQNNASFLVAVVATAIALGGMILAIIK